MGKFGDSERVGLRDNDTKKLIAVYPYKPAGTDEEVTKTVRDWYYKQGCTEEDELRHAFVDLLNENEMKNVKGWER
jgi:hypothetical protein